jgi:hypothetical protein
MNIERGTYEQLPHLYHTADLLEHRQGRRTVVTLNYNDQRMNLQGMPLVLRIGRLQQLYSALHRFQSLIDVPGLRQRDCLIYRRADPMISVTGSVEGIAQILAARGMPPRDSVETGGTEQSSCNKPKPQGYREADEDEGTGSKGQSLEISFIACSFHVTYPSRNTSCKSL